MIEVENLTKEYGEFRAVDNISFSVEKGEILGFLGPNGAGKTTVMRILTCFFPPTKGRAIVAGFNCFEDSLNVRKRIGYLPERVPLYEDMKVSDYLRFVAAIKGTPAKEVKRQVEKVMDDCSLSDVSNKLIKAVSRGYRQRVGIAQALVNDPEVLILDEPTVGLDPKQIKEIRKLIKDLAGRHTVILSTHILPEVSILCGRVIIINKGKLVAVDRPENLAAEGSRRMFLRINGNAPAIEQALSRMAGVKSVERELTAGEDNGFVVVFDDEKQGRQGIHSMIENNRWELLEMRTMEASLEDIFIKLVTKEEA
ncbi:MAG: MFS transporter [Gallionellales bacterium RIFCSPLOWO2_12_FULL_59_22]|nr:MAG: MFS transporter [Gallionellales bacterium RIFCSPLOWO2_02_FULL_59_110]OGT04277.1 MAG: MFS transporter [Gallionellales bacterium RIFCSPLOWO2_02_58_13]OGT13279.1 MAG: MFS transporter [Gallionellales bacterium RIFCSPLOWO2_12_FULL_59_22]